MATKQQFNLNRLAYFVAIVEEKTITAAAQRLELSKAVVSKHLQLLEEEIGVSLLTRNTRHISPTEAGNAFYLHAKEVLRQAEAAFESVIEDSQQPSGKIRITASVDFGVFKLSPLIAKFSQAYPRIEIDLVLSDERVDIVAQRFDVSFRIGWLQDSSNRAKKIANFREVAVCAPCVVKKWQPKTPKALLPMPFLAYRGIDEHSRTFIHKQQEQQEQQVKLQSNVSFNVTSALREALLAGHYFAILPDFTINQDLEQGNLVELLPDWQLRQGGIYLVSPPSRLRTQALRLFIEFIAQAFDNQK